MSTNEAHTLGRIAQRTGLARVMPLDRFLLPDGSMDKVGARAWYAGWDAENLLGGVA